MSLDTLQTSKLFLEEETFNPQQAECLAQVLAAIDATQASKEDVAGVEHRLSSQIDMLDESTAHRLAQATSRIEETNGSMSRLLQQTGDGMGERIDQSGRALRQQVDQTSDSLRQRTDQVERALAQRFDQSEKFMTLRFQEVDSRTDRLHDALDKNMDARSKAFEEKISGVQSSIVKDVKVQISALQSDLMQRTVVVGGVVAAVLSIVIALSVYFVSAG